MVCLYLTPSLLSLPSLVSAPISLYLTFPLPSFSSKPSIPFLSPSIPSSIPTFPLPSLQPFFLAHILFVNSIGLVMVVLLMYLLYLLKHQSRTQTQEKQKIRSLLSSWRDLIQELQGKKYTHTYTHACIIIKITVMILTLNRYIMYISVHLCIVVLLKRKWESKLQTLLRYCIDVFTYCIYVHVCMYVYICICMYVHVCMYVIMYVCSMYMYVCMCVVCTCMYVCMYVFMYVCM